MTSALRWAAMRAILKACMGALGREKRERTAASELRSCVKVEMDVLGLIIRTVSVDEKQH